MAQGNGPARSPAPSPRASRPSILRWVLALVALLSVGYVAVVNPADLRGRVTGALPDPARAFVSDLTASLDKKTAEFRGTAPGPGNIPYTSATGLPIPGNTSPESADGATSHDKPASLTLADGTRVDFPAAGAQIPVSIARESNNVDLKVPGLQTSGSMRVLSFGPVGDIRSFVPTITIPAPEIGKLDPVTVNVARIADMVVEGKVVKDQISYLPVSRDRAGNLVVKDVLMAQTALRDPDGKVVADAFLPDSRVSSGPIAPGGIAAAGAPAPPSYPYRPAGRLSILPPKENLASSAPALAPAAVAAPAALTNRVTYVAMTFQGSLEWANEPQLVRMLPDKTASAKRRPADPSKPADKVLLEKPVVNVVILVHGHNEEEKAGFNNPGNQSAPDPWKVAYKRDAWTLFYQNFLAEYPDRQDCTAFYEFIYPTYRPVYSPLDGREVLGDSLAKALAEGAANDGAQMKKLLEGKAPVNLEVVAHSMGGLVARAALRNLKEEQRANFQQLVTWGTPHHGSPLVTLAYVLRSNYNINFKGVRLPTGNAVAGTGAQWLFSSYAQVDTPGTRDLRWDNGHSARPRMLKLDEMFEESIDHIPEEDYRVYNLTNGTWLYNENLRQFNESDPYALGEKYTFLYGVTAKTITSAPGEIGAGASAMPILMAEGTSPMSEYGGLPQGATDGAAPLPSLAGIGIAPTWRTVNLGDIDHEEYFGAPSGGTFQQPEKAEITARRTFQALGIKSERCNCAKIEVAEPKPGSPLPATGTLALKARLVLPAELDKEPGRRVKEASAILFINGTDNEYDLGKLSVARDGTLEGKVDLSKAGSGRHELVIRAYLVDGTKLDSPKLAPATGGVYQGKMTFDKFDEAFLAAYRSPGEKAAAAKPQTGEATEKATQTSRQIAISGVKSLPKEGTISISIYNNVKKVLADGDYLIQTVDNFAGYPRFLPVISGELYWALYKDNRRGDITITLTGNVIQLENIVKGDGSKAAVTYKLNGSISGKSITGTWSVSWDGTELYAGKFEATKTTAVLPDM